MDIANTETRLLILMGTALVLFNIATSSPVSTKTALDMKTRSGVSAGHICIETRAETSYENVTVYYTCLQKYTGTCGWFLNTRNCTKLRPANCSRSEIVPVTKNVTRHVCCTGWARDDQFRCLIPVCKNGCLHGGTCVDKDGSPTCECTAGYAGSECQNNIDECSSAERSCDHICVDTNTSYMCLCREGYILGADKKSCHKNNEITTEPVPGYIASPRKKSTVNSKTVYVLIAIGVVLLILLMISSIYLLLRRKERLAMESVLKDRVTLSTNDYDNPAFRGSSTDFISNEGTEPHQRGTTAVYITRLPVDHQGHNSDIRRDYQNAPHQHNNTSLRPLPVNVTNNLSNNSPRISHTSTESLNSNVSTGWTNPLFLNAREPENNRPATYAMIEEKCYSGSNQSGIYTSIPDRVQTLEGFDVGESNDYDSFSSGEFEQEAVYQNGSIAPVDPQIQIKSVYLHTPCQSMQSVCVPIQEENDYEYVSDNCNKKNQVSELEYDYVANDDDMFKNRGSSVSSQFESKLSMADDALYEDTDSPNTTLDTTVEEVHKEDNTTYNYVTDDYSHDYDYAANPASNDYYEDGRSIDLQLRDLPEDYDYVSNANITQSLENMKDIDNTTHRQCSINEEFTGPATYYDDATLLAMNDDFDTYPDYLGELPEYEYVRNSSATDNLNPSDHTLRLSNNSTPGSDKINRVSAVSYASIDGTDGEFSINERDYDEIKKRVLDNVDTESEGEYDSDYERVTDVDPKETKELNGRSSYEQKEDVNPVPSDVKYQTFGADKGSTVLIVDNEPVYDEVCLPDTRSDDGQDR